MSHFYGTLQGTRGEATRCGSKGSGMTATAAGWGGAIETRLWHDEKAGVDRFEVRQRHWRGSGVSYTIATGIVGEESA